MAKKSTSRKSTTKRSAAAKSSRTSSRKTKASSPKRRSNSAGEQEVTIDRRRKSRRKPDNQREPTPAPEKLERRQKVNRRRQIDPTTCERDYTKEEVEFMNALDEYKRASGRMFPTCSEVLEVVRSLGYVRLAPAEASAAAGEEAHDTSSEAEPATADEDTSPVTDPSSFAVSAHD